MSHRIKSIFVGQNFVAKFLRYSFILLLCLITVRQLSNVFVFTNSENSMNEQRYRIWRLEQIFDDAPVIDRPKKKILVIAEARSGSSFFGDLLQHFADFSYYAFEPLIKAKLPNLDIIFGIFQCRFDKETYLVNHPSKLIYMFFNTLLKQWATILEDQDQLFNETIHLKICRQSSLIVVKSIRFHLIDFQRLISTEPQAGDIKVILLVRDPRAVMSSRFKLKWCLNSSNCTNNIILCDRMRANLEMLAILSDYLILVRYEDLVANISRAAERIAQHFDISVNEPFLKKWIQKHTSIENPSPQSTYRNLATNHLTTKWLSDLSPREISDIESTCSDVMDNLGYVQIASTTTMDGTTEQPDKFPIELRSDSELIKSEYPLKKFSILE